MKKIGFVPVRIGSKSIPKKNIKFWNGEPLLYWVCKALEESKEIDEFYLASDSIEIDVVFKNYSFKKGKLFNRNKSNSGDDSSSESVLMEFLSASNFRDEDAICFCQATSPYLTSSDINQAFEKLSNYDSILSVTPFERFIWDSKGIPLNYDYNSRPRRQDFDKFYQENGALYISKISDIVANRNRISGSIGYHIMDTIDAVELDNDEDWILSEFLHKEITKSPHNTLKNKVKLFISDIDGTLTDGGMYYGCNGEELKKFNTRDGMGFQLLKENNISTALITSENTKINVERANKLKIDYLIQNKANLGKLQAIEKLVKDLKISLSEIAYIGDDINCLDALKAVGLPACPQDASKRIKSISNIRIMSKNGGDGCVREFIEFVLEN